MTAPDDRPSRPSRAAEQGPLTPGLPISRRGALAGLGSAWLLPGAARPAAAGGLETIARGIDSDFGLAALNGATGEMLAYRSSQRFALCSTFKWILAAQILSMAERHELGLGRRLSFTGADLLDYAPVARANSARGWMTVDEACAAAVSESDNTAANLLLRLVGGPRGLTRFLRSSGDTTTRLDRNEPSLNRHSPGDPRDTTTPLAMVRTMNRLLLGGALSSGSRRKLAGWLQSSTRGLGRLRAGFPSSWIAGNKAGTGPGGAVNDLAIAWPPGRAPILIACYLAGGSASLAQREQVQARSARLIVEAWG